METKTLSDDLPREDAPRRLCVFSVVLWNDYPQRPRIVIATTAEEAVEKRRARRVAEEDEFERKRMAENGPMKNAEARAIYEAGQKSLRAHMLDLVKVELLHVIDVG